MEWNFTFQRAERPQFFVMIYSPYDENNRKCAWHMCYRNTYANINTSQHKGMDSIKNVEALLIYQSYFKTPNTETHTNFLNRGQTVSVPEEKVWK
jgi:hypothetical protein